MLRRQLLLPIKTMFAEKASLLQIHLTDRKDLFLTKKSNRKRTPVLQSLSVRIESKSEKKLGHEIFCKVLRLKRMATGNRN